MKLVSLNMEGKSHIAKIVPFLKLEKPDIVCLLEAPDDFQNNLRELGYQSTFAPMMLREQQNQVFPEGVMFATLLPHHAEIMYYHGTGKDLKKENKSDIHSTIDRVVIVGTVEDVTIATTHFTWTPQGEIADKYQTAHLATLLHILENQPPHLLCGDFNIPRNTNPLYKELLKSYSDAIPLHYKSSLDPSLHRHGSNPNLQVLFESFMVDYLFTQVPYEAPEVRLELGVSDHAAVVAHILKQY